MIIFKLNLFMHKKRIKTNIFGVSLKRQALYPPLRHIHEGTPKTIVNKCYHHIKRFVLSKKNRRRCEKYNTL